MALAAAPALCADDTQPGQKWLHDFSGPGQVSCKLCHYCRTGPSATPAPRWGGAAESKRFAINARADDGGALKLQASQACLACHDGAMGVDPPRANDPLEPLLSSWAQTAPRPERPNHHAYGVAYDPARKPYLAGREYVEGAGLPLYPRVGEADVYTIECPTCHEVHQPGAGPLLRITARDNVLCFACHRQRPASSAGLLAASNNGAGQDNSCRGCHSK